LPILIFLGAALLIVIDQITKWAASSNLKPIMDYPIINGWLHLHYSENTGAAFGMFSDCRWIFITVSIVFVIICIGAVIMKKVEHPLCAAAVSMIIAGGVGNLIDRIRLGYVVDFIYVKIINFAIFNVADMCVCIGAVLLGYYILFIYGKSTEDKSGKAKSYANRVHDEEHK